MDPTQKQAVRKLWVLFNQAFDLLWQAFEVGSPPQSQAEGVKEKEKAHAEIKEGSDHTDLPF